MTAHRSRVLVIAVCIAAALLGASRASVAQSPDVPNVVVIGIDGMDPQILQRFIDEGRMPNFAALIESGTFSPLGTSVPPQSPVAWSNFITGMDPGGHGIFDFIHRDPQTYSPVFSAADVGESEKTISIGDWVFPVSAGETKLLRQGEAFWQVLDRHDIPNTIFRVPANFPPAPSEGKTISGMGTPDIIGSYGTFSFYTDDDIYDNRDISGGRILKVSVDNGRVGAELHGPENALRKDRPVLSHPFTVDVDAENETARITVGKDVVVLQRGEWSEWITVGFDVMGPIKKLNGIARFYLRSVAPYFELYVTPLNIDPAAPALPISTPDSYAADIARRIGKFYTQGMAEDTKALEFGMFDDAEFITQTDTVLAERWRMLDTVLDDYDGGFLFFYVSTVDQSCHMLWRNVDTAHPAHVSTEFAGRFAELYENMDRMLGEVVSRVGDDVTLMVMSDHGFAPYYKRFHLNTWLYENGYLALVRPEEVGRYPLLGNVFWRRTKAYALGINGLYVNMIGREARGVVGAGAAYDELLDEITEKLLAERDPETGEQVITRVYRASETYHGELSGDGPDLIIGYNRGYRGSDESALGTLTTQVMTPNMGKWTGSHCMDHTLVPGVLISNRPFTTPDPDLKDLPVSILNLYGIDAPAAMRGRALFSGQ